MVNLKSDLQPTAECLAVERFGEPLTAAEQAHLGTCSRCATELSLWQSFVDSKPAADEGAAVQWIVSELRRRRTVQPAPLSQRPRRDWLASIGWRPLAGAAAVVLAIGTGYLMWDPEPRIGSPASGAQTYRTSAVRVIAPSGDLAGPPSELTWVAVAGAMRYDVQVLEIDKTLLWSASAPTTRIELPRAVVGRIVPGKTLLWAVTAVDGSGRTIAESAMQSFRVTVDPGSGRN